MSLVPMVSIVANGPSCALLEARIAFGWTPCAEVIECIVPDDASAQKLADLLSEYGLRVEMYAEPAEYR